MRRGTPTGRTTSWTGYLSVAVVALLPLIPAEVGARQGSPPAQETPVRTLHSWTSDRHVLQEGDIITVLVDEYLLASAKKDQSATQLRDRDLGFGANSPGSTSGITLRTRNDTGDRQRGESSRQQRFSGELSARILEVSPTGMMRLEGTKKLQIDEVEEAMTVRGWVRPQDLSLSNTVESWRLSDAEILFTSNGSLGKSKGFWSKLLNWIWP